MFNIDVNVDVNVVCLQEYLPLPQPEAPATLDRCEVGCIPRSVILFGFIGRSDYVIMLSPPTRHGFTITSQRTRGC